MTYTHDRIKRSDLDPALLNFKGCAEMGNVDLALLEPVAVERLATRAAHDAGRPLRRQPFAGSHMAYFRAVQSR
jgi:hypothetical protein